MCELGDTLDGIDRCIAPLVEALNAGGQATVASCCGHQVRPGRISLRDGRELFIVASYDEAQDLDRILGSIHGSPGAWRNPAATARSLPKSQEPKSEASEPAPYAAHTDQGAR